jgi:hypothetical protein
MNESILTQAGGKALHDFIRPFGKTLSLPDRNKLLLGIKGMAEGATVRLSEIGRCAQKDILPKKFSEKMGKSLYEFASLSSVQLQKCRNLSWKYFILDESDIQRPHAEKIAGAERVRDGSTGNIHGRGYGMIAVIGVTEEDEHVPLILERYSEVQPARKKVIAQVIEALGPDTDALWLIDRGGDDEKLFSFLLTEKQQFLIRLDRKGGQRCLTVNGPEGKEGHKVSALTAHMDKTGYRRVGLPKRAEELTLLHYHGYKKQEPMALLTTLSPRTEKQAANMAKAYLKRWKIEAYLQFIKGRFGLEDIMIKLPERVDGLLAVVLLASAFVMRQMWRIKTKADGALTCLYTRWAKRERCALSWSSAARFLSHVFRFWAIILRTLHKPHAPDQLALIWS